MPLPDGYNGIGNTNVTRGGRNRRVPVGSLVRFGFYANGVAVGPAAAVANGLLTTLAGPNTTTATLIPGNGLNGSLVSGSNAVFDYPRNVVITVTHASAVVALSGVITGKDYAGNVMTEAWSVTAGTASKTFTGKKAFKSVSSVTIVAAADASADSIVIGSGTVFGLYAPCDVASPVKELTDGAIVTNGTLVAKSSSASADRFGTYSPNTAPNGTHTYEVWYISLNPTNA